jgi:hypothetical protein
MGKSRISLLIIFAAAASLFASIFGSLLVANNPQWIRGHGRASLPSACREILRSQLCQLLPDVVCAAVVRIDLEYAFKL